MRRPFATYGLLGHEKMMGVKPPLHHTTSKPSEKQGYCKRKEPCWYLLE